MSQQSVSRDEHPLYAIHFAIQRNAHLARVVEMPRHSSSQRPCCTYRKVHLPLRNCGSVCARRCLRRRCQRQRQRRQRPRGLDQIAGIDTPAGTPGAARSTNRTTGQGREEHQRHADQQASLRRSCALALVMPACLGAPEIGHDIDDHQGQRQSEPLHRIADVAQGRKARRCPIAHIAVGLIGVEQHQIGGRRPMRTPSAAARNRRAWESSPPRDTAAPAAPGAHLNAGTGQLSARPRMRRASSATGIAGRAARLSPNGTQPRLTSIHPPPSKRKGRDHVIAGASASTMLSIRIWRGHRSCPPASTWLITRHWRLCRSMLRGDRCRRQMSRTARVFHRRDAIASVPSEISTAIRTIVSSVVNRRGAKMRLPILMGTIYWSPQGLDGRGI